MKIKIIKKHEFYPLGEIVEVEKERAVYLILVGVAEEIKETEKKELVNTPEKVEFKPKTEKVQIKRK